jgi:hypothetical protein
MSFMSNCDIERIKTLINMLIVVKLPFSIDFDSSQATI